MLLTCAAGLVSIGVAGQPSEPAARRFLITHFRSRDNLPENHVSTIFQSSNGYLWVGTWFGFARFDGLHFTVFDKHSNPEIEDDTIVGFAEDQADHSLWIGTAEGGLYHLRNGRLARYSLQSSFGSTTLQCIGADSEAGVWVGNQTRFGHFQGERLVCTGETDASLLWIRGLANGRLRLATSRGLREFDPQDHCVRDCTPPGGPTSDWTACGEGRQPGEWYVGSEGRVWRFAQDKWGIADRGSGLPGDRVQELYADRAGGIWIGTGARELQRLVHGLESPISLGEPGFVPPRITCLLEDQEGTIWVGSDDGLFRLRRRQLLSYTMRDGLVNNQVWSVCAGPDGVIWAGTTTGVSRFEAGAFSTITPPYRSDHGVVQSQVRAILADRTGDLWVGTKDGPLQWHAGTWTRRTPDRPDCRFEVSCLYQDRSNAIWIATSQGVLCYGRHTTNWFTPAGLPCLSAVCSILQDRAGTLWLGADRGGLIRYQGGTFKLFSPRDGLAGDDAWALYEDADGTLWIGGETGLTRYRAGRFSAFRAEQGLEENTVNCILEDDRGYLWLSGLHGIYRVARSALDAVADGLSRRVNCVAFREADGMESSETNGEDQPAGWKDPAGRLWFPTDKGLVVIDPREIPDQEVPPPVVIEAITANDQVLYSNALPHRAPAGSSRAVFHADLGTPLQLPPEFRHVLKIQFTANSFVDPNHVRLKYRLDGHDTGWQDDDGGRQAVYTNLRPGRYHFQVIAGNHRGDWNLVGAGFDLRLAPYFHETWLFYAVCAAALLLFGGGVQAFRLSLQQKILRLEQRAALERERSRIARDIHDDLGAHLTQIAILSEVARQDAAHSRQLDQQLARVSAAARSAVSNISELVWATNPRNDTLANLLAYLREYIARYFEPTPIRCHLSFPSEVPDWSLTAEFRRNLFLAVKEILHNAVKHSEASQVEVTVSVNAHQLALHLADNGRGFNAATVGPFRAGLSNLRNRIHDLNGLCDLQSRPGSGTQFQITLPLAPANP
ncbi:MAG: hypothetical protein KGS61_07270 [Verrucomicrobia bacterium]|nr:hypothetical protein [Verrucomicrobiota bacterium]